MPEADDAAAQQYDNDPPARHQPTSTGSDGREWFPASYVQELRSEAATWRIRTKAAESAVKANPPEALTAANATIKELRLDAALREATIKYGADHALTSAVLAKDGTLAALDPSGRDFAEALDSLVEETIARHGALRLKSLAYPSRSGSDWETPRPPAREQFSREDVAANARTNPQAVMDAMHRGELQHMGIGPQTGGK